MKDGTNAHCDVCSVLVGSYSEVLPNGFAIVKEHGKTLTASQDAEEGYIHLCTRCFIAIGKLATSYQNLKPGDQIPIRTLRLEP